ncbi:MAG: YppE family protein [Sporolactobacillus sp.]|nr:YppE family protein [Sporolactobacillus sp.]
MEQKLRILEKQTQELKKYNRAAFEQFTTRTRQDNYQTDFYHEVKPFADRVQRLIDQWKPLADDWVRRRRPKYVYPIQIKATYENLAIVSVTAFQKDTRRRRFIETVKAIDYVLDNMLVQLKSDGDAGASAGHF